MDGRFWKLYIYDPRGIYCKVFPISPCDCLDLLGLYQYSGRDIVKGTASICSEILCWLWRRAGLPSNLFGWMWISRYDEDSDLSAHTLLYLSSFIIEPPVMCRMWEHNCCTRQQYVSMESCGRRERKRDVGGKRELYRRNQKFFFFLKATTADEFGCPGLLNHHGAADSSAETNDFDFTCDITSKLCSQSIAKRNI